jgi:hypothetical protein
MDKNYLELRSCLKKFKESLHSMIQPSISNRTILYTQGCHLGVVQTAIAVAVAACKNQALGSQKAPFSARIICKN